MSFTLTSSAAILYKAGANQALLTHASSGAIIKEFCDQAEAELTARTGYDWVANYATITTNYKAILADVVSAKAAWNVIKLTWLTFPQDRKQL